MARVRWSWRTRANSEVDEPLLPPVDNTAGLQPSQSSPPYHPPCTSGHGAWRACWFSWITPLMTEGSRRQLQAPDLLRLDPQLQPESLGRELWLQWSKELLIRPHCPSLLRTLARTYGAPYVWLGLIKLLNDLLSFSGPLLLKVLVTWLTSQHYNTSNTNTDTTTTTNNNNNAVKSSNGVSLIGGTGSSGGQLDSPSPWSALGPGGPLFGWVCVVGLAATAVVRALLSAHFNYQMSRLSCRLRAALVCVLYRKSLLAVRHNAPPPLTAATPATTPAVQKPPPPPSPPSEDMATPEGGEGGGKGPPSNSTTPSPSTTPEDVSTLMSVDTGRVVNLLPSLHEFWSLPAQMALALYLLYRQVRYAFLSGVFVSLALLPINRAIAGAILTASAGMMTAKDARIACMGEVLRGIRAVKTDPRWQDFYVSKIAAARQSELHGLAIRKYLDALCVYFWAATQLLTSGGTFGALVVLQGGAALTPAVAFTALALFGLLTGPLNAFPWVVNGVVEAVVSVRRLQRYLCRPETKALWAYEDLPISLRDLQPPVVQQLLNAATAAAAAADPPSPDDCPGTAPPLAPPTPSLTALGYGAAITVGFWTRGGGVRHSVRQCGLIAALKEEAVAAAAAVPLSSVPRAGVAGGDGEFGVGGGAGAGAKPLDRLLQSLLLPPAAAAALTWRRRTLATRARNAIGSGSGTEITTASAVPQPGGTNDAAPAVESTTAAAAWEDAGGGDSEHEDIGAYDKEEAFLPPPTTTSLAPDHPLPVPNALAGMCTEGVAAWLCGATFAWQLGARPCLYDISLSIPRGALTAVVGRVGAGKSSLLAALMGGSDLPPLAGRCCTAERRLSYAPQQPWVTAGSVRDNVVLGSAWDETLYEKVLHACALLPDLATMPGGDKTVLGDHGSSLSGGQRARLGLARALYHTAIARLPPGRTTTTTARNIGRISTTTTTQLPPSRQGDHGSAVGSSGNGDVNGGIETLVLLDDVTAALDRASAAHVIRHALLGDVVWPRALLPPPAPPSSSVRALPHASAAPADGPAEPRRNDGAQCLMGQWQPPVSDVRGTEANGGGGAWRGGVSAGVGPYSVSGVIVGEYGGRPAPPRPTVVAVTTDPRVIAAACQVVVLEAGRVVYAGPPGGYWLSEYCLHGTGLSEGPEGAVEGAEREAKDAEGEGEEGKERVMIAGGGGGLVVVHAEGVVEAVSEADGCQCPIVGDEVSEVPAAAAAAVTSDERPEGVQCEEEEREVGHVRGAVYGRYLSAVGWWLVVAVLLSLVAMQASRNASDLWVSLFAASSTAPPPATTHPAATRAAFHTNGAAVSPALPSGYDSAVVHATDTFDDVYTTPGDVRLSPYSCWNQWWCWNGCMGTTIAGAGGSLGWPGSSSSPSSWSHGSASSGPTLCPAAIFPLVAASNMNRPEKSPKSCSVKWGCWGLMPNRKLQTTTPKSFSQPDFLDPGFTAPSVTRSPPPQPPPPASSRRLLGALEAALHPSPLPAPTHFIWGAIKGATAPSFRTAISGSQGRSDRAPGGDDGSSSSDKGSVGSGGGGDGGGGQGGVMSGRTFLIGLLIIAGANSVFTLARAFSFAFAGLRAARLLHDRLLAAVLAAPMAFFDSVPHGRILNRFSSDVSTVDDSLPFIANIALANAVSLAGLLVVLCFSAPALLPLLLPLALVYRRLQLFYRSSSREVRRLEALALSPVYSSFGGLAEAAPLVRAFGAQEYFLRRAVAAVEGHQRAAITNGAASAWLGLWLQLLAAALVAAVATLAVRHGTSANTTANTGGGNAYTGAAGNGSGDGSVGGTSGLIASLAGLSLAYALPVVGLLNGLLTSTAETEQEMVAVERLGQYMHTQPQEDTLRPLGEEPGAEQTKQGQLAAAGAAGQLATTAAGWQLAAASSPPGSPAAVTFDGVVVRYRPGLRPALCGVCLAVGAGEHVGVVGRTGAGKSSLVAALMRLVEVEAGRVLLHGVDVRSLPLRHLRTSVGVLSQSPFLATASLRENLDPELGPGKTAAGKGETTGNGGSGGYCGSGAHTRRPDADMAAALRRVGLWDALAAAAAHRRRVSRTLTDPRVGTTSSLAPLAHSPSSSPAAGTSTVREVSGGGSKRGSGASTGPAASSERHAASSVLSVPALTSAAVTPEMAEVAEVLDIPLGSSVGAVGLSAGQAQLLCLARLLLQRRRVVVLDEASASVDPGTAAAIRRVVREEFLGRGGEGAGSMTGMDGMEGRAEGGRVRLVATNPHARESVAVAVEVEVDEDEEDEGGAVRGDHDGGLEEGLRDRGGGGGSGVWRCAVLEVAHRLSAIRVCDRVAVMEGGVVVEEGPPGELAVRPGGWFGRLQAAGGVEEGGGSGR